MCCSDENASVLYIVFAYCGFAFSFIVTNATNLCPLRMLASKHAPPLKIVEIFKNNKNEILQIIKKIPLF